MFRTQVPPAGDSLPHLYRSFPRPSHDTRSAKACGASTSAQKSACAKVGRCRGLPRGVRVVPRNAYTRRPPHNSVQCYDCSSENQYTFSQRLVGGDAVEGAMPASALFLTRPRMKSSAPVSVPRAPIACAIRTRRRQSGRIVSQAPVGVWVLPRTRRTPAKQDCLVANPGSAAPRDSPRRFRRRRVPEDAHAGSSCAVLVAARVYDCSVVLCSTPHVGARPALPSLPYDTPPSIPAPPAIPAKFWPPPPAPGLPRRGPHGGGAAGGARRRGAPDIFYYPDE